MNPIINIHIVGAMSNNILTVFPEELLEALFDFAHPMDLLAVSQTCRTLWRIVTRLYLVKMPITDKHILEMSSQYSQNVRSIVVTRDNTDYISSLPKLRRIRLVEPCVTPIPQYIQDLHITYRSGSVPDYVPQLTNLTCLFLPSNFNYDLKLLTSLTNLQTLCIGGNSKCQVSSLSSLARFSKLTRLICRGYVQRELAEICVLTNLKSLEMGCSINTTNFQVITQLTNLQVLNIGRGGRFYDLTPIFSLTKLSELKIRFPGGLRCTEDNKTFSNLTNMTNLKTLCLSGVDPIDTILKLTQLVRIGTLYNYNHYSLHNFHNLVSLGMFYDCQTTEILQCILTLTRLCILRLRNENKITNFNDNLKNITCLQNLEYLTLGNPRVSLIPIVSLPVLRTLTIDYGCGLPQHIKSDLDYIKKKNATISIEVPIYNKLGLQRIKY